MRKETCLLLIAVMVMVFGGHSICEAAHFSITGTSNINAPVYLTFTQFEWCNFNYGRETSATTIDADGAEQIGDPVTVNYCFSATASTTTPGSRYVTIGGIGDALSFNVACLPSPTFTPSSNPATLILNPGAGQTTVISYGPQVLTGNESASPVNQCGTFQARIGDTLQANFGIFVLLYDTQYQGPAPDSGGSASFNLTFDANLPTAATAVPILTEWGMIILVILLGIGSLYYLRRRRVAI